MQPVLQVAAVLSLGVIALQFSRKVLPESVRWPRYALCAALVGFLGFLLRGSADHYNYYIALALILYLCVAYVLGQLPQTPLFVQRRVVPIVMALLLLNNLVFAGAKTYVVWVNRGRLDEQPMKTFLAEQTRGASRIVLPPNLWIYGSQNFPNYRLMFTPIVNLPDDVWAIYHARLLKWKPDVIVVDKAMLPPRRPSLTPEEIIAAGYTRTGAFSRVFRYRNEYTGYDLEVYRRQVGPLTSRAPDALRF
jgi:hypothetical protein